MGMTDRCNKIKYSLVFTWTPLGEVLQFPSPLSLMLLGEAICRISGVKSSNFDIMRIVCYSLVLHSCLKQSYADVVGIIFV
jgi:hypothetical protein